MFCVGAVTCLKGRRRGERSGQAMEGELPTTAPETQAPARRRNVESWGAIVRGTKHVVQEHLWIYSTRLSRKSLHPLELPKKIKLGGLRKNI